MYFKSKSHINGENLILVFFQYEVKNDTDM